MLKVLAPIESLSTKVTAYSLTADEYPTWVVTSAYDQYATVAYIGRAWKAAQYIPPNSAAPGSSQNWVDVGPLNRWAMFDGRVSTRTVGGTAKFSVTLVPGRCNGVALLDMIDISTLTIIASYPQASTQTSDTTTEYAYGITLRTQVLSTEVRLTYTINLENRANVSDWKTFFKEPYQIATDAFVDLPSRADMTITIETDDDNPQIGSLIIGNFVELGDVGYGVTAGIEDYSNIITDDFGVSTLVPRDYVKRVSYPITVPNYGIRRAYSTLAALRATPAVFIGSDDYRYTPFTVFGIVENFELALSFATYSVINVDVRGIQT